jgi:hypothetical protein
VKNRPALWAILGVIAALILVPTAAVAANTIVTITGGGNKAWVDKAHRLLSAEADPSSLVNVSSTVDRGCQTVYTTPGKKQLIIKTMDFVAPPPSSANSGLKVYPNGDCTGQPIAGSDIYFSSGCCSPTDHVDFGAGAALAPGQKLSISNNNNPIDVYLHGYLTPAQ